SFRVAVIKAEGRVAHGRIDFVEQLSHHGGDDIRILRQTRINASGHSRFLELLKFHDPPKFARTLQKGLSATSILSAWSRLCSQLRVPFSLFIPDAQPGSVQTCALLITRPTLRTPRRALSQTSTAFQ